MVFQLMHTFVANAEVDTSVMAILKRNVANYATATQSTTPQFLWMEWLLMKHEDLQQTTCIRT